MYSLGVDLGALFTAAATWRDGHVKISSLGSRAAAIPSVVLLREDSSVVTGEAASRRALLEPGRVAREFKRHFGDATPILLGGTPYSAESLMARLLKSVVVQVASQQGGPPSTLCLCHPANWGRYRIDLLQQAVRMADIDVPVSFVTEPAAAAAYYARQQRLDRSALVAVYDLGGGTFDATVLRRSGTGFDIVGRPERIEHLGGADFDAAVFQHVRGVVGHELDALDDSLPSSVAAVARLREECTFAKETLSSDTDTTIPVLLPHLTTEVRITRAELEQMVRPLLHDTVSALQRAIRSAGVSAEDLHSVLLIGGSSRMPLVAQLVGAELDRPVAVDAHPKHAVALGAAWVAGERLDGRASPTRASGPASYSPPRRPMPSPPPRATRLGTAAPPAPARQTPNRTGGRRLNPPPAAPPPARSPAPPLTPPAAPPPVRTAQPGQGRQNILTVAAAAAAMILVIAAGGYIAGRSGLFGGPAAAQRLPSPSNGLVGTAGAKTPGGTASTADPDTIFRCPTSAEAKVWGCLTSALAVGNTLVIDYTTNFPLSPLQDRSHYHFHAYLANTGPNGTTIPPDSIMQHVPGSGSWFIITSDKTKMIDNSTERGGQREGIDTAKYELLCVRVAVGLHALARDAKGGYRTGNCVQITH